MDTGRQLYADGLPEGLTFEGEEKLLTAEMFGAFAALTGDSHPIHSDPDYASRTRFGRPVAHGLLLVALTAVGATAMSARLEAAMVALIGESVEFRAPAFIGDRITSRYTVVANSAAPERSTARVEILVEMTNDAGDVVLEGRHVYLLRCRPS